MRNKQVWIHLVARSKNGRPHLSNRAIAAMTWARLKRKFPHALGCVLMPNHIHLITRVSKPGEAHLGVVAVLRGLTRQFGLGPGAWDRTPEAEVIPDRHHLLRQIRYVHLNPCRASLAADPIAWEWSTHRDYLGLIADSWINPQKALTELNVRNPAEFHRYVSSDPSVQVSGTPAPPTVRRNGLLYAGRIEGLDLALRQAVRSAAESCGEDRRLRSMALALADRELELRPRKISAWLGISTDAIRQARCREAPENLERVANVVARILADPRCR